MPTPPLPPPPPPPRPQLAFGRKNYLLLLVGLALLAAGFVVMSIDGEPYGFGFAGLTLGPLLVMAGFVVEFFAIMVKDRPAR